jgi:hypothetical protein
MPSLLYSVTEAVESALANYIGEDPTADQVELVADRVMSGIKALRDDSDWSAFETMVESSSTYVQTDLDELGLADYVGEIEAQLEEFGIL